MSTELLLQLAMTCIGTLLLAMAAFVGNELRRLTKSVEELNLTVAATGPRIEGLERRLLETAVEHVKRMDAIEKDVNELRIRTHNLFSYLTAIRLKAELAGWKFTSNDWKISPDNS